MLRRRLLGGKLPAIYQRVEYIESTGTQYINTLVPMDADDYGVYIDFYQNIVGSSRNWYFSFGSAKPTAPYNGLRAECNMAGKPNRGTILSTDGDPSGDNYYSPWYVFGDRNKISANYLNSHQMLWTNSNGTWNSPASGQSSNNGGYYIYLFCLNTGGSTVYFNSMRLYECKISKGASDIRNFIPCYRKTDNVIGLYDTVGKQFYTNAGSGTFSKGPNV